MTYQEIVDRVREHYKDADAEMIQGHLAVQFNITGEGHGAFYLEVKDSRVSIQPYEYYSRNAAINLSATTLFKLLNKETTLEEELNHFHITCEGDIGAVLVLKDIRPITEAEVQRAAEERQKAAEEAARVKAEMNRIVAAEMMKAEAEVLEAVENAEK
ncbi:MAG: SCP2 sterol-binding domain-containing protein [Lachnospiraceae bacterium]|nr:SCP2 sterol-binding domain-containing protein [Lachnospiraceae bacterium]